MHRREFLKWFAGIVVSAGTVVTGFPSGIFSPVKKMVEPSGKSHNEPIVLAKDRGIQIAVLSDLHIQDPQRSKFAYHYNAKVDQAIDDVLSLKPDVVLVVGDITHHGYEEEYRIAKQLFRPLYDMNIPIHVTMGNHEFYNKKITSEQAKQLFLKEFNLITPYQNFMVGSVHIVMLSPEYLYGKGHSEDWARLSIEQLHWFKQVLQQHSDIPTLVFLHQPLNDTVEQSQYEDWIARTEQTDELLAILEEHPQVKCWFSGHTHAPLELKNQIVYRHGIWFFGGASTYFTSDITPKNGKRSGPLLGHGYTKHTNFRSNQSRLVSVQSDKILVRARDHTVKSWISGLEQVISIRSTISREKTASE